MTWTMWFRLRDCVWPLLPSEWYQSLNKVRKINTHVGGQASQGVLEHWQNEEGIHLERRTAVRC